MIEFLTGAAALIRRYDVLFCDVWGVLHDGRTAYPGANSCLPRFRAGGGRVVLVSNAPLPGDAVAGVLDSKGVSRLAWDAIVTSGDLTRLRMVELGLHAIHHVGPPRDLPLFAGLAQKLVAFDEAEALVVTGLVHDARETADDYRHVLEAALAKQLPLICANPDLSVEVGGRVYPCAGAIAALYAQMGGNVHWEGKPYPAAYELAFKTAEKLGGHPVKRDQVLAIGDAVRTDLAGAARAGIDALFIVGGLHREALMADDVIDRAKLDDALGEVAATTRAAMPYLVW